MYGAQGIALQRESKKMKVVNSCDGNPAGRVVHIFIDARLSLQPHV